VAVGSLARRLGLAMRRGVERRRLDLERLTNSRAFGVAPVKVRELQQRFDEAALRLAQAMEQLAAARRQRERVLQARLLGIDLGRFIRHRREFLAGKSERLDSATRARLRGERSRLALAAGRLDALSPLAVLKRGYAICRDARGAVIKDAQSASAGDRVEVALAQGGLDCRVEKVKTM